MLQTLVLIRHAHRDTSRREQDNGLDDKGRDQAKALKRFFNERFSSDDFKKGLWLVSSPKFRCQETLSPIARDLGRTVDSHPDLNERSGREDEKTLSARVKRFLDEWRESKMSLTLLCSHGDWLPIAISHLLGLADEPRKGCWLELDRQDDRYQLKWYIPSFKPLFK